MNEFEPAPLPERNPVTHERHRREVLLQITIPILIGAALVLIVFYLVTGATSWQASKLADVSVIWLIAPTLIVSLLFLVVLIGLIYVVVKVVLVLPVYFRQAQDFMLVVTFQVGRIGNKAVEPILRIQSFTASLRAFDRGVRRK